MQIEKSLNEAIEWAEKRLHTGEEPPPIYYRLMQLIEAATELMPYAMQQTADLPQLPRHPESVAQLQDAADHPNSAQLRLVETDEH